ncbi:chaplin [Streptomyces sp. ISL-11]|uniref:chaplin n=1 Tax=Streptomyces sp. ISL-11 TaxID=2819174 RepID=UPI001BE9B733|nr:chaplin [Streptomyces sp. ISL-11]MBT2386440.1 chaplin [Streptomyces sp. ISL-11]
MRQVGKKSLITVAAASGVIAMTGAYAFADSGAYGVASNSPGVASGNTVQVPVSIPVNACGNTVNVVGALNPASGNRCVNGSSGHGHGGHGHTGGSGAYGSSHNSPGVVAGNTVQAPVSVPVNACGNSVNVVGVGNPATGNHCVNGSDHGHGDHHGGHDKPGKPGHHKPPTGHNPPGEDHGHKPPTGHHKPADHTPPAGHHAEHPAGHKPTAVSPAHTPKGGHMPAAEVKAEHRDAPLAAPAEKAVELAHTGAGQLGMAGAASAGLLLGGAVIYRRARAAQN